MSNFEIVKDVGIIEENIEIIKNSWLYNDEQNVKFVNAIEHILQDYTRQKQINEEHQKINGELREKVKELEEENMQKDLEIIGKEEYTEANMKEIISQYYTANEDCIQKQKIQDKIEELKDTLKHYNDYSKLNLLEKVNVDLIDARIEILQELLQEEENDANKL